MRRAGFPSLTFVLLQGKTSATSCKAYSLQDQSAGLGVWCPQEGEFTRAVLARVAKYSSNEVAASLLVPAGKVRHCPTLPPVIFPINTPTASTQPPEAARQPEHGRTGRGVAC